MNKPDLELRRLRMRAEAATHLLENFCTAFSAQMPGGTQLLRGTFRLMRQKALDAPGRENDPQYRAEYLTALDEILSEIESKLSRQPPK